MILRIFLLLIGAGTLLLSAVVHAQNAQPSAQIGIAVAPSLIEASLTPGAQKKGSLALKNTSATSQNVRISVQGFDIDSQGVMSLMPAKTDGVDVIFTQSQSELAAGESYTLTYTLRAAADAPDGVRTLAVVVETVCDNTRAAGTHMCVRARIAVPLLVTVNSVHGVQRADVKFQRTPAISRAPVSRVMAYVRNTGTRYLRPQMSVVMTSVFGREVARVDGVPQQIVLPQHTRTLQATLTHPRAFGLYRFSAHIADAGGVHQSVWWGFVFADRRMPWLIFLVIMGTGIWLFWRHATAQRHAQK